ncbi:hypothetical protein BDZ89DRAFT_1159614 [Hymenopellis radicata]|nr:hypothetical protein BDZ89DRAFT_1159614 [Hymenopellis radicata]
MSSAQGPLSLSGDSSMFQATPSKVAASQQGFNAWRATSGIHWIPKDNPTIQNIRRDVEDMSQLVVPQEWRDPDYHPQYDKLNATDFRKAVVSAASSTSFKGSDDRDSFAIFAAFHTLLALHQDIRSRHGKNDATFRRNIDALVTDVFAHQYVVDGKPEFGDGNFHALLEEGIWLKENHVTTSEAHPDALVAYGPISADHIHLELENVIALESTTISPSQLPLSPLPPMPASTDDNPNPVALSSALQIERVAKLYTNVHFQHNVSDDPYLFLLAVLLEYKSGTSLHKFHQLAMDFTTAQLQRRALRLKERTLFGLALGRDGAFIYASFWSDNKLAIGWDPVHVFSFKGNVPAQIVKLFLFLRRLAKSMTAQLAEDRQAVASNTSKIALNFQRGLTVWRTCDQQRPLCRHRDSHLRLGVLAVAIQDPIHIRHHMAQMAHLQNGTKANTGTLSPLKTCLGLISVNGLLNIGLCVLNLSVQWVESQWRIWTRKSPAWMVRLQSVPQARLRCCWRRFGPSFPSLLHHRRILMFNVYKSCLWTFSGYVLDS